MVYFDNAATTGHKPQSVIKAVDYSLKHLCANPGRSGHDFSQKAALSVYNARKRTAEFFGADIENVVFTANCTTSINYVLKGVLSQGDHIVVSDLEHNAVMRPLKALKIDFSIAEVSLYSKEETIKNFKKAIKPSTKLIFCTAASNVLGNILPIKEIGEMCKQKNILFGVDAAQAAGILPINMKEMKIDYLCVAAHKGLYCPMGLGILIAQGPISKTVIEGGTGTESVNFMQPQILPEMLESGTVNLPAIASLSAGYDFVNSKRKNLLKYENSLVSMFYNSLKNDVIFYVDYNASEFVPVICFNFSDFTSEQTADILNKNGFALRGGLHCAPTAHQKIGTLNKGAVRFSPSVFNTHNEVESLIYTIKNLKKCKKAY